MRTQQREIKNNRQTQKVLKGPVKCGFTSFIPVDFCLQHCTLDQETGLFQLLLLPVQSGENLIDVASQHPVLSD